MSRIELLKLVSDYAKGRGHRALFTSCKGGELKKIVFDMDAHALSAWALAGRFWFGSAFDSMRGGSVKWN
jgi:hypothetical protein